MLGMKPSRRRARPYPIGAPVGGINARDSLEAMAATDAVSMLNWFPSASNLKARKGYTRYYDLETGSTVVPLPYVYGSTKRLLVASGTKIWDLTDTTLNIITLERYDELAGMDLQHAMFNGRMFICNGVQAPLRFWNDTIDEPAFTADTGEPTLDDTKLEYVFAYKSRLYFVEKNTQRMWYGGVNAIQGALKAFDFSLVQGFEGRLMFVTALTGDGGDGGNEDLFIAVFSSGDVAIYSGSFPGDDNWNKIGTYKIGKPMSKHAHAQYGSDVIVATTRGYESLQRSTRDGEAIRLRSMLNDKIHEMTKPLLALGPNANWRLHIHKSGRQMIFQGIVNANAKFFHVRNIDTGAWTEFTVPNGHSWCDYDGVTMLGGDNGRIYTWDNGYTDDGTEIRLECQPAWSYMGSNIPKTLQFMYFNITSNQIPPTFTVYVNGDYDNEFDRSSVLNMGVRENPAHWNEDYWNEAYWTTPPRAKNYYHKQVARGRVIGIRLVGEGYRADVAWNSTTFIVEDGGLI